MLDNDTIMMLVEGTRDTLYMTLMSTFSDMSWDCPWESCLL